MPMDKTFEMIEKRDIEALKAASPEFLLERNGNGDTPLMMAINGGWTEAVDHLLSADASPFINAVNSKEENALFYAIYAKNEELAFKLIGKGADIHHKCYLNQTTLFVSVMSHLDKLSKELILRGVDVNDKIELGQSPVAMAALYGQWEVVKLLLDFGADKDAEDMYGMNAASWAHFHEHFALARFLQEYQSPGAH